MLREDGQRGKKISSAPGKTGREGENKMVRDSFDITRT
uniref:Uncharacterized protein n=1 Tax=uncultured bacterium contig00056 TaxID=1181540 RepID=A0A806KGZ9_9BACT|nr:hypothetical protein [uncultured bacterium contig00056]